MKIIIAKEAGFCFGVKRAAEMTIAAADSGESVQTFGSLIHNPDYIAHLESKGVTIAKSTDEISADNLVIRAHGIPSQTEKEIAKGKTKIIDATCPFVKVAQRRAKEFADMSYKVILLGEETHPEIIGIKSYAPDAIVVTKVSQLPAYKKDAKIAFLSQTTQSLAKFNEMSDYLNKTYTKVKIINTICDSTEKKQNEAANIAQKVDLMLVIGGKNSSNTTRLREVCEAYTNTRHIENAQEIQPGWLRGVDTVGITAGASTPDYSIEAVIDNLKGYNDDK